jgi:hypothetical protein
LPSRRWVAWRVVRFEREPPGVREHGEEGHRGDARTVAGTLNTGGYAQVNGLSCASAGNCAAGGYYLTAAGGSQKYEAFLVSLEGFAWKPVEEVPGTSTLNAGMTAHVNAVSCPSAGFCAAGGFYSDGHLGGTLPFTAKTLKVAG